MANELPDSATLLPSNRLQTIPPDAESSPKTLPVEVPTIMSLRKPNWSRQSSLSDCPVTTTDDDAEVKRPMKRSR